MAKSKLTSRLRRKVSIRKKVKGTKERPRLTVFRSSRHIYAQVIDDETASVLVTASTQTKDVQSELSGLKKIDQAKKIGAKVAGLCASKGVQQIVFDRNGYMYHGRVKALADAAREAGLKF